MITPVNTVMTSQLITIPSGSTVFEAGELMAEKRIRHLPVVDSQDLIVGIVSQRDLSLLTDPRRVAVEWIMSSPVSSVRQTQPLRQAVFQMLERKISCLLVTDEADTVVGIVTTDDLLWYLSHLLSTESEEPAKFSSSTALQTIGEVANKISDLGI